MDMFMKFIFGIAWIGIFILAILGIYIGMFPAYLEILDFNSLIIRGAVVGVSLVYLLLFFGVLTIIYRKIN
jgi:hypothetical protein